jgi:hypothetical protein
MARVAGWQLASGKLAAMVSVATEAAAVEALVQQTCKAVEGGGYLEQERARWQGFCQFWLWREGVESGCGWGVGGYVSYGSGFGESRWPHWDGRDYLLRVIYLFNLFK